MSEVRLIDANALKELEPHYSEDGYRVFYEYEIDNAPTVPLPDFKEGYKQAIIDGKTNFSRPQGEWEFSINHTTSKYPWGMYKCSNCNNWNGSKVRFCPHCRAEMKGGAE